MEPQYSCVGRIEVKHATLLCYVMYLLTTCVWFSPNVQSPLLIDNPTPLVCLAVILVPLLGGGAHSTFTDEGRVASNYLCVCANFIMWQVNYIF